jgi:diacylglycerol kinase (ATP)
VSQSKTDGQVQRRRALLIVNPGARLALRGQYHATRAFAHQNVHCDVLTTDAAGHATQIAREHAAQYDFVFTLGGDGTAMEVMTALAERGPPIGILPGGTGNVLARSFGIPGQVASAVHALLNGREARIDLGRLPNGRHFAIGLGVGLDASMIAGASPLMKKRVGVFAYLWSATKAALRLQHFQVRLTVDGTVYERRAAFVMIANLGSVPLLGRVIRFGDGILHDDGLLHACVFSPNHVWDAVRIFVRILFGHVENDRATFYASGREFRLETFPPRQVQADGELLEMTPIDITVRPQAARVLIPRE